ncbi:ABC transporter permease [Segetibacter aerophilus]|uniref:ABC transporter permease n=1 Tax=Segetibacter aerophilus TaxID=670293 RepID=A0A512BB57_9BACT|nr:ABC transporter permease [Segetibacter aerophilus]GEO09206.1 ABC transporter permease [Segetibacter aerophilus]
MLKNYLHIALRNIQRKPLFAAINTVGLAIGITSFVFIALFVLDELSYDRHFKNSKQIYRLTYAAKDNEPWLKDVPAVAPGIAARLPEMEHYTRLFQSSGLVKTGKESFNESKIFFADTSFFRVFDLTFIAGNAASISNEPNGTIITNSTAKKYFGTENPVGKPLQLAGNDGLENFDLKVVAVIKDLPTNTHFHFDFLIPYRSALASRSNVGVYTYFKISANATASAIKDKLNRMKQQYFQEWRLDAKTILSLQPVTSIHLHSAFFEELEANSNVSTIYIFSITAFLILFIACINYINISLAQSTKRSKEIGLRKILGADKKQVIFQFITESFVHLLISIIISAFLLQALLPLFNQITEKSLTLDNNRSLLLLFPAITALGLMSALYPALVLSRFNPVLALKNTIPAATLKTSTLRQGLLVFQFAVAVVLIICTTIVFLQLSFIRNKNLGFAKEQVVVLSLRNPETQLKYRVLKQELLKNSNILKVAASHTVPGEEMGGGIYRMSTAEAKNNEPTELESNTLFVDEDYLDLMNISIVAGKKFNKENSASEANNTVLVNEAAAKTYGWKFAEATGKTIEYFVDRSRGFQPALVAGVVSNFHYQSLRSPIEPLIIRLAKDADSAGGYISTMTSLSIKIKGSDVRQAVTDIKKAWDKTNKDYPFEYTFLDERLTKLYSSDEKLGQVFSKFSFIVLFITCIGLFGISILTIELRTKEIGIRKVLGASVRNIVNMLSNDFLKLVIIAIIIAFPIAGWAMNKWLQDFAFRINISWWIFLVAGLAVVVIALLTVSVQAIKAAIANPVKSLRTE